MVLVDHAADYLPALHGRIQRHYDRLVLVGRPLLPTLVRPMSVIVPGAGPKHRRRTRSVSAWLSGPTLSQMVFGAATELGLGGTRWEQHLAEIRAINRENERRSAPSAAGRVLAWHSYI